MKNESIGEQTLGQIALAAGHGHFAEFPEGMREYLGPPFGRQHSVLVGSPRERGGHRKNALRETASQPGSPVIPRIEIHDLCTGSEVIISNGRQVTVFLATIKTSKILKKMYRYGLNKTLLSVTRAS